MPSRNRCSVVRRQATSSNAPHHARKTQVRLRLRASGGTGVFVAAASNAVRYSAPGFRDYMQRRQIMTTTRVPLAILDAGRRCRPRTRYHLRVSVLREKRFSPGREGVLGVPGSARTVLHHHVFQHFGDHARLESRLHAAGWYSGRHAGQQRGARRGRWQQGDRPLYARPFDWPGALHILGWDGTLRRVPRPG